MCLVSIDGPGGSGKSTVAAITAELLIGHSLAVHETHQPFLHPPGQADPRRDRRVHRAAPACLCGGDRHHHLAADIRPALAAGQVVLCDRYVPSSLVLQRMDGIGWDVIRQLNDGADRLGSRLLPQRGTRGHRRPDSKRARRPQSL